MTPRTSDAAPPWSTARAARLDTPVVAPSEAVSGVLLSRFAALSLFAMLAARGVTPALPGSATGIAALITATARVASYTSQVVAAGGVVLCIRLLNAALVSPSLGVAFRFAMLPVGLGVIALVAAAITRPLDPELGKVLTIAATVATTSSVPFLFASRRTRGPGVVMLCTALSGALALSACELARHASQGAPGPALRAFLAASLSVLAGLGASLVATAWATQNRKQLGVIVTVAVSITLLVMGLARAGEDHAANASLVFLQRSLDALSQPPSSLLPRELAEFAAVLQLLLSGAVLLTPGQRAEARSALTLALIGSMAAGAPVAALLSVASALLLTTAACDPRAAPEHLPLKVSN